ASLLEDAFDHRVLDRRRHRAHVAADHEAARAEELRERRADAPCDLLVDLIGIGAADVVRLVDAHCSVSLAGACSSPRTHSETACRQRSTSASPTSRCVTKRTRCADTVSARTPRLPRCASSRVASPRTTSTMTMLVSGVATRNPGIAA